MTKSETIRVGKKYTIVLPKDVRKRLNIKEGDLLSVRVEGDKIILEPKRVNPFEVLKRVIGEPYDEEKDEKLAERWLRDARS
jgi:AbrB family looped-hinge helix DNA binding protein